MALPNALSLDHFRSYSLTDYSDCSKQLYVSTSSCLFRGELASPLAHAISVPDRIFSSVRGYGTVKQ